MPPRKTKYSRENQATTSKVKSFVVLCDERNSRHAVYAHDQLLFAKKDNLNKGTYATFNGGGNRASKYRGIVVLAGNSFDKIPVITTIVFFG